ncbi:sensor histidine kinase [Mucilaginibacter calamicampi]|uniref:Sensor histidine kinase n=1 Tax=Mucilaginibacter calamicampi TaxID=1302352 RepID=A0ABW2Z0M7_9SPHI
MKKSTVLIVLMHLVYWFSPLARFYFLSLPTSGAGIDFEISYFTYTSASLLSVVVFYLFYFFLFPRFLYKPQLIKFTAWSLVTMAAAVVLGLAFALVYVRYYYNPGVVRSIIGVGNMSMLLVRVVSAATAACVMKGFITWFTEIRYKEQLEKQNVATNLELLKAKINPHFLFNTLNNIDVLIEKDAATASVYLKKLSDILRFTLYESPSDTIPLKRELDYILQYIDLQKIRTSNPHFVTVDFGNANQDMEIAPMLFMPFIENAFKYSTNKKIDNAIVISIAAKANTVVFNCSNVYDANEQITGEGGLGMTIMTERLQLLYPGNHQLEINKTADRFIVNLTITLHDN